MVLFSAAMGLFLLGYDWGNQYQRPDLSGVDAAILLRPPLELPAFSATDQAGQPLGRERLQGRWSLLLIGSSDSPTTRGGLAQMSRIHNRLAGYPELQDTLQPVFLSPDPELDSADRLRETVYAYNPALTAGSAREDDLRALMTTLGAQSDGPSSLYLIDPQGRAPALFTAAQDPAAIARDIRLILEVTPET